MQPLADPGGEGGGVHRRPLNFDCIIVIYCSIDSI